jgi:primase-polymerase (primpol)-like protein
MQSIALPAELISLPQWVFWRYEQREGEPTKVPYTAMGYKASDTNPRHWSEYGYLVELLRKRPDFAAGIGFVFTAEDPYLGIDLDDIWQSDADEDAKWAAGILQRFADTYFEESPSGEGVKIWCKAHLGRGREWSIGAGAIEIYDRGRFFAVTGKSNGVLTIADHQEDIDALIANLDEGRPQGSAHAIPERIPYGTQHNTLVSLAGTMYRRGMTPEAIEAALLITNEKQCERPGPPANIKRIVHSMRGWTR